MALPLSSWENGALVLVGVELAWLAYLKRYPPPFPFTLFFTGPLVGFDEAPRRPAHGERENQTKTKQNNTRFLAGWVYDTTVLVHKKREEPHAKSVPEKD